MDLALDPSLGIAMLAGVPLPFTIKFDLSTVDQVVKRTMRLPAQQVDGKALLATARGAEIRHIPVQADQPKQALDEPRGPPQGHAEQQLHRQACLDGGVAVNWLSPTLGSRLRRPHRVRIKSDRQQSSIPERLLKRGQVHDLEGRSVPPVHDLQLAR